MPDSPPSFFICRPSEEERQQAIAAIERPMPKAACLKAQAVIKGWPGYAPSPPYRLEKLERSLGGADVRYQDASSRFGLKSFKALGGAYAVLVCVQRHLQQRLGIAEPTLADLLAGKYREALSDYTVCTATDGNHGRSVAWGA